MTSIPQRRCWVPSCRSSRMEPTEQMRGPLRVFRCQDCGAEFPWVDEPKMDGSYAQTHKVDSGYAMSSMMSDPDCAVFTEEQKEKFHNYTPKPRRTKPPAQNKIIFVTNDEGIKTHRWHRGREEWVKIT